MKISRQLIYFFALIIFISSLFGQAPKNNFVQLSVDDGLPSNIVLSIYQDRFGYMWMGTLNGLSRYDGYSFKNYHPEIDNPASLQTNIVFSIFEDKKGDLWIGGNNGLSKYTRETDSFRFYSLQEAAGRGQLHGLTIMAISEDNAGNLLLGTSSWDWSDVEDGVFYLDKKVGKIKKYQFSDSTHTRNILSSVVTPDGETWFGGYAGLWRLDSKTKSIKLYKPENIKEDFGVISITRGYDGIFWLGTHNYDLYSFNPGDSSFKKHIITPLLDRDGDLNIWDKVFDPSGNLWLATSKGLMYYNPRTREVQHLLPDRNNPASIDGTNHRSIFRDFAGSVWLGGWNSGLNRYDPVRTDFQKYLHNPDEPKSYGPGWATFFVEDYKKNVWIGSGQSYICLFNRKEKNFSKITADFNDNSHNLISVVFEDSQKRLWCGIDGYLYIFNTDYNSFTEIPVMQQYGHSFIHSFYEDENGVLWFGRDDGLFSYNQDENTVQQFTFDSFPETSTESNWIYRLVGDKNRNLWIGTNNGLFRLELNTDNISRIGLSDDKTKSLSDHDINSLHVDHNGILWVGTWLGGLNRFDPQTDLIKSYTSNNGLATNSIQAILGDEENGALWLSTYAGITRFDLKKERFLNFNTKDGVHSTEFADGAALKTTQGEFLFGGANGFTIFRPEDIKENVIAPKIIITDFKLTNKSIIPGLDGPLNKPIYEADEIILEHDQNDISFEFLAIHFINSERNHYAYMLENYETEWRAVGQQRNAIYPNLPPGNYTFRVKAANFNKFWNEEGASIEVIILHPWWRSVWAYALYVLFFIGTVYAIDHFQRRRLLNKAKEKMKIQEAELRTQAAELQTKNAEMLAKVVQAESKRKTKELEEARQLQLSMLPKNLPDFPNLEIAVYMKTATEVGGDYYDFSIKEDGSLNIAIGDATGHGMKAGIMVSAIKSIFTTNSTKMNIDEFFLTTNKSIKSMNLQRIMMGFTMINIDGTKFKLVNAGMPPLFLFHNKTGVVEEIKEHGMPIGAMNHSKFIIKESALEMGDVLLLMSDGMPELQNTNNEMFGYERIQNIFKDVAAKEPKVIIDHLNDKGSAWVNDKAPDDDVTFVVIKVKS